MLKSGDENLLKVLHLLHLLPFKTTLKCDNLSSAILRTTSAAKSCILFKSQKIKH